MKSNYVMFAILLSLCAVDAEDCDTNQFKIYLNKQLPSATKVIDNVVAANVLYAKQREQAMAFFSDLAETVKEGSKIILNLDFPFFHTAENLRREYSLYPKQEIWEDTNTNTKILIVSCTDGKLQPSAVILRLRFNFSVLIFK